MITKNVFVYVCANQIDCQKSFRNDTYITNISKPSNKYDIFYGLFLMNIFIFFFLILEIIHLYGIHIKYTLTINLEQIQSLFTNNL